MRTVAQARREFVQFKGMSLKAFVKQYGAINAFFNYNLEEVEIEAGIPTVAEFIGAVWERPASHIRINLTTGTYTVRGIQHTYPIPDQDYFLCYLTYWEKQNHPDPFQR